MKKIVQTDKAPAAIGAYSQAVIAGDTIYVSGQIPLDPITMEVVEGGFTEQANQVFKNLASIAEAAGASLSNAVKLNVYMTNLDDFGILNQIMSDYITEPFPARAAVQVSKLPRKVLVEIDAVLYTG